MQPHYLPHTDVTISKRLLKWLRLWLTHSRNGFNIAAKLNYHKVTYSHSRSFWYEAIYSKQYIRFTSLLYSRFVVVAGSVMHIFTKKEQSIFLKMSYMYKLPFYKDTYTRRLRQPTFLLINNDRYNQRYLN